MSALPIDCDLENSVEISFEAIDPNDVLVKTIYRHEGDSSNSSEKKVERDTFDSKDKRAVIFT